MEDNGQNNNFESRLEDVQQNNQIRQDGDVNVRNADMVGARRSDDVSVPFWNRFHDTSGRNKSPKDNIFSNKSGLLSSKNKNYNNQQMSKGNKNNSLFNNNKHKTDNLSFKQRIAKEALKNGSSIVPGIGAVANAKSGDESLNDTVQKTSLGKKKSLFPFFGSSNKRIDDNGVSKEEEEEENSLDKVSIKILTPKTKKVLSIVTACCVVVCGVCIVMVASQAYITILGVDLSSHITVDSKDVQDKLTSGESKLKNDEIDHEITETSDNT